MSTRCACPSSRSFRVQAFSVPAGETQVVFCDGAFADGVANTNITAILKQCGLENVRSL
jgi:hypothetical protein